VDIKSKGKTGGTVPPPKNEESARGWSQKQNFSINRSGKNQSCTKGECRHKTNRKKGELGLRKAQNNNKRGGKKRKICPARGGPKQGVWENEIRKQQTVEALYRRKKGGCVHTRHLADEQGGKKKKKKKVADRGGASQRWGKQRKLMISQGLGSLIAIGEKKKVLWKKKKKELNKSKGEAQGSERKNRKMGGIQKKPSRKGIWGE